MCGSRKGSSTAYCTVTPPGFHPAGGNRAEIYPLVGEESHIQYGHSLHDHDNFENIFT